MQTDPPIHRIRICDVQPRDPALRRFGQWPVVNRNLYAAFRRWLKESRYSPSALNIYVVAARLALAFLDKPYWQIDPAADLDKVREHLCTRPITPATLSGYHKGLAKFEQFLCLKLNKPVQPKAVDWQYYIGTLSPALQTDVRDFLRHCQRAWKMDVQRERTTDKLSSLTASLRWMAKNAALVEMADLTPEVWYRYLDQRLASGITPTTTNSELSSLKHLVHFLQERAQPICERFLLVDYLDEGDKLPRDLPVEKLQRLLGEIQVDSASSNVGIARLGRMDRAWFLLMLHSGLRSAEVRFLRMAELELSARRVFLRQAKGLKDRVVFLSDATITALQGYLVVRGPAEALPEHLFIFRHQPLSKSYCYERLRTYGERCGVKATPHQLRHSCATLLLNAGAPVLTVQALLGHKWVDTTLGYARLYDGTVAADYFQAMALIESRLALPEDRVSQPPSIGQLVALADALHKGTLNPAQAEVVRSLQAGLRALQDWQNLSMEDVKVQT